MQCNIPVRAERPREDGDVTKHGFERLVEDVAHLVLEILRRDEGIEQVEAPLSFESNDLAAGATDVGVDVEGFPEVVYARRSGLRADVEEDTDVWLRERWGEF